MGSRQSTCDTLTENIDYYRWKLLTFQKHDTTTSLLMPGQNGLLYRVRRRTRTSKSSSKTLRPSFTERTASNSKSDPGTGLSSHKRACSSLGLRTKSNFTSSRHSFIVFAKCTHFTTRRRLTLRCRCITNRGSWLCEATTSNVRSNVALHLPGTIVRSAVHTRQKVWGIGRVS